MCGALTFAAALAVVREQGQLMQSLFATGYGMLALNRLPLRQSVSLVKENSEPYDPHYVAIINTPDQIVAAGTDSALDAHAEGAAVASTSQRHRIARSWPRSPTCSSLADTHPRIGRHLHH
jgi:malonate decarboxylase epsilon subunit